MNELEYTLSALREMAAMGKTPSASRAMLERISGMVKQPVADSAVVAAPKAAQGRKPTDTKILAALEAEALGCMKCPHLAGTRTQVVFGTGNPDAELMFIGEAPGADEDKIGEPFVGEAGQLLTKMIDAMGFARSDVYIANVLKCRPDTSPGSSGNRRPRTEEMQTCLPYLKRQLELIRPIVVVALGGVAMEGLFGTQHPMRNLRGRWHDMDGMPVMATYHPAYLLRNSSIAEKRKVWEDLLKVLEKLGKNISPRQYNYFTSK